MNIKLFLQDLRQSSPRVKTAIVLILILWAVTLVAASTGMVLFMERTGQAIQTGAGVIIPSIELNPAIGQPGSVVTVQGQGWQSGRTVLVYLLDRQETVSSYAVASAVITPEGRFETSFVVPTDPRWQGEAAITVVARLLDGDTSVQAFFELTDSPASATPSPAATEPTVTPVLLVSDTPTVPLITTTTDLNIRSGPGIAYPVLGVLPAGQAVEATGRSIDDGWYQIKYPAAAGQRGWLSGRYVTVQNVSNLPVVSPPPLPLTATPTSLLSPTTTPIPTATPTSTALPGPTSTSTATSTPTRPVITEWRGEYYANPRLEGEPALVRNDRRLDFYWADGGPDAGLPIDNFSVRWNRTMDFEGGLYQFHVIVDDGVRLWIDDQLVIDDRQQGRPREISAEYALEQGEHHLKVEYFERFGGSGIRLWWDEVISSSYADWQGEYWSNRTLEGNPVFTRNDESIEFDWGYDAPAAGFPGC